RTAATRARNRSAASGGMKDAKSTKSCQARRGSVVTSAGIMCCAPWENSVRQLGPHFLESGNSFGQLSWPSILWDHDGMTTDDQRLERISQLRAEPDAKRAELITEIHDTFHENRGLPQVRGWLAKVAKASGYTREY